MKLLDLDYTKRISAENAMKHPFFKEILEQTPAAAPMYNSNSINSVNCNLMNMN
jgi:serine/threonine protein kinase